MKKKVAVVELFVVPLISERLSGLKKITVLSPATILCSFKKLVIEVRSCYIRYNALQIQYTNRISFGQSDSRSVNGRVAASSAIISNGAQRLSSSNR